MEQKFLEGIYRALSTARDTHQQNRRDLCVIASHLVIEYGSKALCLRAGKAIGRKDLKDILDELLADGQLDAALHSEMDTVRRVRNRTYHVAYLPTYA
jgi:HEPN domain-containing protein